MIKTTHKENVGKNLRAVRVALGWSQSEMAHKFNVSDKSAVSHWERGKHYPDPYFVQQLWAAEGITADWVYFGQPRGLPAWVADRLRQMAEAEQGSGATPGHQVREKNEAASPGAAAAPARAIR